MENYFDTPDQLSTSSILALFETNKEQRSSFVTDIINRLDEGQANPLEVHLQVKAMEDIICQLTSTDPEKNKLNIEAAKKYKQYLSDAFTNNSNGQKSFSFHNAEFRQMEAGSKWHYEKCEDKIMDDLLYRMEELKTKIKEREKFLQSVPKGGLVVTDEDTGETYKVYPPYKTSSTSIAVKLK